MKSEWRLIKTPCDCPRPCSHGLVPTYIEAEDRVIVVKEDATAEELRLISAAPDLLAACEAWVKMWDGEDEDDLGGDWGEMMDDITDSMRDVIDKARGRS